MHTFHIIILYWMKQMKAMKLFTWDVLYKLQKLPITDQWQMSNLVKLFCNKYFRMTNSLCSLPMSI